MFTGRSPSAAKSNQNESLHPAAELDEALLGSAISKFLAKGRVEPQTIRSTVVTIGIRGGRVRHSGRSGRPRRVPVQQLAAAFSPRPRRGLAV